jgi:hypothetical protein
MPVHIIQLPPRAAALTFVQHTLFDPLFEYLLLKHFAITVLLDLLGTFQMFPR